MADDDALGLCNIPAHLFRRIPSCDLRGMECRLCDLTARLNDVSLGKDFFRSWETADGHVVGLIIQDAQYAGLCRVLNRPDLAVDPRFEKMVERFQNWLEMVPLIAEEIGKIPTDEFLAKTRNRKLASPPAS